MNPLGSSFAPGRARLLHIMTRVGNLERAIAFYCNRFSMRLLRRRDFPEGRSTLAFLSYDEECVATALEPAPGRRLRHGG